MAGYDVQKLRRIQLGILSEFIKICEKYEITYFAVGGTCLGAIRHCGYIPWDDDIDIALPRADFNKLRYIIEKELPSNLFWQTTETDKEYPHIFAKIRDNNTTFIEKDVADLNMNHGVYIDIFPIDGVPSRKLERKLLLSAIFVLKTLIAYKCFKSVRMRRTPNMFIIHVFAPVILIIPTPFLIGLITRLISKYKFSSCQYVSNYGGAWGDREIVPRKWLESTSKKCFEGMLINVPKHYDEYLRNIYGDYMTLPPKEKQVAHHDTEMVNLDVAYTDLVD